MRTKNDGMTGSALQVQANPIEEQSTEGHALLREIAQAKNVVFAQFSSALATWHLTPRQFALLGVVQQKKSITVTDLRKALGFEPGAMTGIVDGCVARGLVQRQRSREDRRMVYVELTDDGHSLLPKIQTAVMEATRKPFAEFSDSEIEQFHTALDRINSRALVSL